MRKFLIGTLVVVLLAGGAAAVAEWYVRARIVNGIAAEVEAFTGTTPDVSIDSFPVLLDLARGTIRGVEGTAAVLEAESMAFEDVAVQATEIRTGSVPVIGTLTATATTATVHGMGFEQVIIDAGEVATEPLLLGTLHGEALLPAATVQALLQQQMEQEIAVEFGDGVVTATLTILRQDLAITLAPEVTDGALSLLPTEVTLAGIGLTLGDLPFGLGELVHPFDVQLPIAPLALEGVTLTPEGAQVRLSGTNVSPDDF